MKLAVLLLASIGFITLTSIAAADDAASARSAERTKVMQQCMDRLKA